MRFLARLITMSVIIGIIAMTGEVTPFVDLPGLIFVALVGTGITVAAHGLRVFELGFRAMLGMIRDDEHEEVAQFGHTAVQSFVAAGWIGAIIGAVQALSQMDDPSAIGTGIALSLLTVFYGYLIGYIGFLPMSRNFQATNFPTGNLRSERGFQNQQTQSLSS